MLPTALPVDTTQLGRGLLIFAWSVFVSFPTTILAFKIPAATLDSNYENNMHPKYQSISSMREATETRNALYNLQWSNNEEILLVDDFIDPQDVKTQAESPDAAPVIITPKLRSPHHYHPNYNLKFLHVKQSRVSNSHHHHHHHHHQ